MTSSESTKDQVPVDFHRSSNEGEKKISNVLLSPSAYVDLWTISLNINVHVSTSTEKGKMKSREKRLEIINKRSKPESLLMSLYERERRFNEVFSEKKRSSEKFLLHSLLSTC